MTHQLKEKIVYFTKLKQQFVLKYGLLKQEVLDKQKILTTYKPQIQEVFDALNTAQLKLDKVGDYNGTCVSKIVRQSSYAVDGKGNQLKDEKGNKILISGRVDSKKLKEKYPLVYADCLVPTKSVEYKFEVIKKNND